ncbi:MAG: hypothetical protein P4L46_06435 [Fimbriimonas sp.]|nr:hypothetical protein [Fimbriimonas sp.]
MPFKNFSIWRGRLPHWRASDVTYYVTFRSRRHLEVWERSLLLRELLKPDGKRWQLLIVSVLPEKTDLVFRVCEDANGLPYELSQIVERAKTKAGKLILKKSGERFSPFYNESFDRILRDESELEERWTEIFEEPISLGLASDPEEYETLWIADSPN